MNILKLQPAAPPVAPSETAAYLSRYGLEIIEEYSDELDNPVSMQLKPTRLLAWADYDEAFRSLLSITEGIQWLMGDLMAMGENLFPDRFEQAAPVVGKKVKTLQNWQAVAKSIPAVGKARDTQDYIENVHKGEFQFKGVHIGNLRHPQLDWAYHQKLQRLRGAQDLLDIRAIVLTTAIAENFETASDVKTMSDKLLKRYAESGSQAIRDYLDQQRNFRVGFGGNQTVATLEFNVAKGATYMEILKDLRLMARRLQAHAETGELTVKTKAVK